MCNAEKLATAKSTGSSLCKEEIRPIDKSASLLLVNALVSQMNKKRCDLSIGITFCTISSPHVVRLSLDSTPRKSREQSLEADRYPRR